MPATPHQTISQWLSRINREAGQAAARTLARKMDREIHPEIRAVHRRGTAHIEIRSPLLPVHDIIPQRYLRQRIKKRVFIAGEGIFQSFHNPIKSGDDFIVAWYRDPDVPRFPISYVLRDPIPLIQRRVRAILSGSGRLDKYAHLYEYGSGRHRFADYDTITRSLSERQFKGGLARAGFGRRTGDYTVNIRAFNTPYGHVPRRRSGYRTAEGFRGKQFDIDRVRKLAGEI